MNGAMTIRRADIRDGLNALRLMQTRFNRLLKEDSYACGYQEGFADALLSVAKMIGVSNEFENATAMTIPPPQIENTVW